MDENFKKEYKQLSALEMANKIQEQLVPFSDVNRILNNLPRIAQYEQMNSAANIASKALQQSSLIPAYLESQSAIEKFAQSQTEGAMAFQDIFLEARKGLSSHNNILSIKERVIQSMRGANVYEDMVASVNSFRKSLEPLRSSFNIAHSVLETSEISRLIRDLRSHKAINNSILSDYAGVLQQVESLRNLESFKAISRLKNFPFEDVVPTDSDDLFKADNNVNATILELDAEISDELCSVDDFDKLSTENKSSLISLYQNYYSHTVLNYLTIIILLSVLTDNKDILLTLNFGLYSEQFKTITLYLYQKILEPFLVSYSAAHLYSVHQAKKHLKDIKTKSKVKSFTRISYSSFNRSLLRRCRVTISDSLELKDSPNISAPVIDTLAIGTLLEILDKSDRSWLLVEVEIDGELEQGWVLRRYTTYFK